MTHNNNARGFAAEGRASEGARMDGVDTDPGRITPDDSPFALGGETSERPDELSDAVTDEDTAAAASLWIDEENSEEWMNNWSGRVETHSMFRRSYE